MKFLPKLKLSTMKKEKKEKKEKTTKNKNLETKKKRRLIRSCGAFWSAMVIIMPAIILVSISLSNDPHCHYEAGSCIGFTNGKQCLIDEKKFQVQGGYNCTTQCQNDFRSFKCECPEYRVWQESILKCSLTCFASDNECNLKLDNQHCIPKSDVNGGSNCTMWRDSQLKFNCSCPINFIWDAAKFTCVMKECPLNGTQSCDNSTETFPCINLNNLNDECETICFNGSLTYKCSCPQLPSLQQYDVQNNKCVHECRHEEGSCTDYQDGKPCLTAVNIPDWSECKTVCAAGTRNFNCTCPAKYTWNLEYNRCDLICPDPPVPNCLSVDANIDCVTTRNIKGGDSCKTICSGTNLDFECSCPALKLWSPIVRECQLACIKGAGSCGVDYPDATPCIPSTDVNGGSSCKSDCSTDRSFTCSCPTSYTWKVDKLKCVLKCPFFSDDPCVEKDIGYDCVSTLNLNGGLYSQIRCANTKIDFTSQCFDGKMWSLELEECNIKCLNEIGPCGTYTFNTDCIPSVFTNYGTNCLASCPNNKKSFTCSCPRKRFNMERLKCEMFCPSVYTDNCESLDEESDCTPTYSADLNGGTLCKIKCIDSKSNFYCSCPDTNKQKKWSFKDHQCQYVCLNEENDNCNNYENTKPCLPKSDVNGGYDCLTVCSGSRSFKCTCPTNYMWNDVKLKCDFVCPSPPAENCTAVDEGFDCLPAQDINGGKFCKIRCIDSKKDFYCTCPDTKSWSQQNHTCIYNCVDEASTCDEYVDGKDCIAPACSYGTACLTICTNRRSFNCSCLATKTWNADRLMCR